MGILSSFEGPHDGFGITVDDGQQDPSRPVRDAPSLFPVLHRPGIEAESVCESLTAELHALAEPHDALGSGIINDSAGKRRFPSHMGEHFPKSRFHLTSQICWAGRHRFRSSFLIVATSRESTFLSARLMSSRSAFA